MTSTDIPAEVREARIWFGLPPTWTEDEGELLQITPRHLRAADLHAKLALALTGVYRVEEAGSFVPTENFLKRSESKQAEILERVKSKYGDQVDKLNNFIALVVQNNRTKRLAELEERAAQIVRAQNELLLSRKMLAIYAELAAEWDREAEAEAQKKSEAQRERIRAERLLKEHGYEVIPPHRARIERLRRRLHK